MVERLLDCVALVHFTRKHFKSFILPASAAADFPCMFPPLSRGFPLVFRWLRVTALVSHGSI